MKRKSWFYGFMKAMVTIGLKLFYRKMEVYGSSNIPKNSPLIFAANHQSTLMDGVLIVWGTDLHIASLTRADIFKNPIAKWFLNLFMMIPIYRPRDNVNTLEKNLQVFSGCYDFLQQKGAITIFPEGSNGLEWHLRSFKKGCARIALGAEAKYDFDINLHIIPTGIHYQKNGGFQKDIIVHYGKPIGVKDYEAIYKQNTNKAINELIKKVRSSIKENMLHIEDLENYRTYTNALRILRNNDRATKSGKNFSRLKIIREDQQRADKLLNLKLNDEVAFSNLKNNIEQYDAIVKQYKLRDYLFTTKNILGFRVLKFFVLFACIPLWLYSILNCGLGYLFNHFLIKKSKVSKYFLCSVKMFFGFFGSGLVFLIQAILVCFLFCNLLLAAVYFISLPLAGLFWYYYNVAVIKLVKQNNFLGLKKEGLLNEAIALRKKIVLDLDQLLFQDR